MLRVVTTSHFTVKYQQGSAFQLNAPAAALVHIPFSDAKGRPAQSLRDAMAGVKSHWQLVSSWHRLLDLANRGW